MHVDLHQYKMNYGKMAYGLFTMQYSHGRKFRVRCSGAYIHSSGVNEARFDSAHAIKFQQ